MEDKNVSEVDRLIRAITAKLEAKKLVLADSVEHGRLSWRRTKDGKIEVKLQPEV